MWNTKFTYIISLAFYIVMSCWGFSGTDVRKVYLWFHSFLWHFFLSLTLLYEWISSTQTYTLSASRTDRVLSLNPQLSKTDGSSCIHFQFFNYLFQFQTLGQNIYWKLIQKPLCTYKSNYLTTTYMYRTIFFIYLIKIITLFTCSFITLVSMRDRLIYILSFSM